MSRLVVKSHRPWQFALAIILLSTCFAVLTWLLLENNYWAAIQERIRLGDDYQEQLQVNRELEQENQRLRNRVLTLEQTIKLDKRTAALLQEELTSLQDKIHELRGELEFYHGIMESTRETEGLNIYGVHVTPLAMQRSFLLRLVLTHVVKGDKVARGRLKVSIAGVDDKGVAREYNLKDLTIDDAPALEFEFKNFQRIERHLTLPDGFEARRIYVLLQPSGRNQATISKVFEWPAAAS